MRPPIITAAALLLVACTAEPEDQLDPVPLDDDVLDGKADGPGTVGVELKITLPAEQTGRARRVFRLRDERAEQRAIWFFDTLGLALLEQGLVLRARSIAGEDDDSTVKVRPLAAEEVEPWLWGLDGFKCELDRMPDREVASCSLTAPQGEDEIESVAGGEREVAKLFSEEQEAFLERYAPLAVDLEALLALGPTESLVWAVRSRTLDRKVKLELWTLADGSTILEVSCKVDREEAAEAEEALREYLEARNLDVASAQETKTRAALERLVASWDEHD